ncbi:MAG: GDSL family lipase [Verrucomicrobiales bacterium]|nr:GDSL family lipase [Verrucomicrobiales bacterium]
MKISLPLSVILLAGCLSVGQSQTPAPSLATTPVLHPGTEKKHESFNAISKQGTAELVFLGDSITAGWAGAGKDVWAQTWEPLKAANFGIGGDRTEHILWRLQHGNYDGLKAKLTVLMIGTNNTGHQGRPMAEHGGAVYTSSPEQTAAGVAEILKLLREKQPQMQVLLLAIFPRGATPDDKMRQQNEATNQLIARLADGKTVHFLDIGATFLGPDGSLSKEIMPDLLHLSPAGYQKWADAIAPKVKELLAK